MAKLKMDINHLHLAVNDLDASKSFYRTYFGFEDSVVHGKIQFMVNWEGFHLALDPAFKSEVLPKWFHFGVRLRSESDVEALHNKLLSEPKYISRQLEKYPGHVFFHCIDPDGYKIEVYWEE